MDKSALIMMAYKMILSNIVLDEYNISLLQNNNINTGLLKVYYDKIDSYRRGNNNSLTIDEQSFLYEKFGNDCLEKIKIFDIDSNNLNESNSNNKSNSKTYSLSNGKKQFGVCDETAFSDIYMFGFLVFIFQVLFLIISYIIFSK